MEEITMAHTIHDVADYIDIKVKMEDSGASLINLKLQKLLYYIQAWSYGKNGKPLFDGEFQAWIHGPVNKQIYDRFNPSKYLYSEIGIQDVRNKAVKSDDTSALFVDFILENYMKYSGAELEKLSHSEAPWIKTRGQLGENERCEEVINPSLMIDYYGKKWREINK